MLLSAAVCSPSQPTADAMAVSNGQIIAVGDRLDVDRVGRTGSVIVGDECVMPGFVDAHGHPLTVGSDAGPLDVVDIVHTEVTARGAEAAYLVRWDPLLQNGLPEPNLTWLDQTAADTALLIVHNRRR